MSRSLAAAISDDTSGAPECCQLDPNSGSFLPASYVRPDADTWSFGCIASELATWIVRGMWGLQAYREARKDAHDDSWLDGDCFHEGYRTLPYIRTHHDRLVENLHMDLRNATIGALTLVQADMLQFDPKKRKHPGVLMHEAKSIMIEAAKKIKSPASSMTSDQPSSSEPPDSSEPPPSHSGARFGQVGPKPRRANSVQPSQLPVTQSRRQGFNPHPNPTFPERRATADSHESNDAGKQRPRADSRMPRPVLENLQYGQRPTTPTRAPRPLAVSGRPRGDVGSSQQYESLSSERHRVSGMRPPSTYTPPAEVDAVAPGLGLGGVHGMPLTEEPERMTDSALLPHHATPPRPPLTPETSQTTSEQAMPMLTVLEAMTWRDSAKHSNRRLSRLLKRSGTDENPHWRHLSQEFEHRDFVSPV